MWGRILSGLQGLDVDEMSAEQCKELVGIGTDGASASVAVRGLKSLVEERLSWVLCHSQVCANESHAVFHMPIQPMC